MSDSFSVEQKLRLLTIDYLVSTEGRVRNHDLMRIFNISRACASRDFKRFRKLWPNRLVWEHQTGYYIKSAPTVYGMIGYTLIPELRQTLRAMDVIHMKQQRG